MEFEANGHIQLYENEVNTSVREYVGYFRFFSKSKNVSLRFFCFVAYVFFEQWLTLVRRAIGLESWKLLLSRRHIVRKSHSVYWYCHSICGRRYNSPAAAGSVDVLLHLVQNHHFFGLVQPIGLVDYESLKKSV